MNTDNLKFLQNRKFVTPVATLIGMFLALIAADNVDAVALSADVETALWALAGIYNMIVVGGDVMYDRAVVNAGQAQQ